MKLKLLPLALLILIPGGSLFSQDTLLVQTLKKHVEVLASDSLEGRGFGFDSKLLAVDYIEKEFKSAGLEPLNDSFLHPFTHITGLIKVNGLNIAGVVRGSDPVLSLEYIVIGAHYDHMGYKLQGNQKVVYNGADDNASGVAAIIEVGRYLVSNRDKLKRSVIIIAFDGEEAGLIGSARFLSESVVAPSSIKAMLSLDMVGMYRQNGGVNLIGMNTLAIGERILTDITGNGDIKVKKTGKSIASRTDTWPFAKYGIPSVQVTTGTISPYHKPEDDSHLLDYEGIETISRMVSGLTVLLADSNNPEPDTRFISNYIYPNFRVGFTLGVGQNHHHFSDTYFTAKPAWSYEAGFTSQLRLSESFRLQTGVLCEFIGSKGESGVVRTGSLTPHLNLLLTTPAEDVSMPSTFLLAGAYYRYNFTGSDGGQKIDFEQDYSVDDYGLNIGAGFQYMNIQFAVVRRYGLKAINTPVSGDKFQNRGYSVSLTSFF